MSQSLGGLGSLAVSAWSQEYWHRQSRDETVHLGFYSAWKGISWGVGYYYTRASGQQKMTAPGHSISIFRWVVRCPTAR